MAVEAKHRTAASSPSASSLEDQELVQRALAEEQGAFSALLSKYRQPIRHHVSRMVRDKEIVDDLLQEIFIKAFSSLASYSTNYAFSTWLYKIATNHTIDYLRRKKLSTLSIDQPMRTKDGELEYELPDSTYRPDKHILESQRKSLIQDAIDSLPPKYYRVIVLRHQQELSYDEIAKELGLPLGTVKAHIFRARELLYKRLRHKKESL